MRVALLVALGLIATLTPPDQRPAPDCSWALFDVRVDAAFPPSTPKAKVMFRYSHPAGGSAVVDFGGSAGTVTTAFTGGCELPSGSFTMDVDPSGIGEVSIELRDLNGKVKAKTTAYVEQVASKYVTLQVYMPNNIKITIDKITWNENMTVTLAMDKAARKDASFQYATYFYDSLGRMAIAFNGSTLGTDPNRY